MNNIQRERWASLKEFDGNFEISDFGEIRSINRIDYGGSKRKGRIMSKRISKGYYCTSLSFKGKSHTVRHHRLVANYFVENPNLLNVVNHLDGNSLNNHYSNLEWTDHIGNTIHAIRNRLTRKPGGKEKTLTEKQVMDIFLSNKSAIHFIQKYGVCRGTINMIRNGLKWGWLTGKKYKSKDGNRKYIDVNGEKMTYSQLAKNIGATPATITYRLRQGWSIDKIIANAPKKKGVTRWVPNQRNGVYI